MIRAHEGARRPAVLLRIGGGAGHASHATCDFRKLGGIETYSVTDNVSELTARINDDGWDTAYANWLAARSSGRTIACSCSPSAAATRCAREREPGQGDGAGTRGRRRVAGVVGRDGGGCASSPTRSIVIPTVDDDTVTPQTEGLQALMWHLIVSHPALVQCTPKWESLTG